MNPHADLDKLIQEMLPTLSPQLGTAARFLLQQPHEAAMDSMRAIASQAGVRPATMVRLAHRLGFSDYNALRTLLRERVRTRNAGPFEVRARDLAARQEQDRTGRILADTVGLDEANLRRTWEGLDPQRLDGAVEALAGARRIYFLGRRSCHPVAFSLAYAYSMIRGNGILIGDQGAGLAPALIDADSSDVLVCIAFEPYSRETVALAAFAADAGLHVIAITDTVGGPFARCADFLFGVANDSPSFFQSIIAAQSLAQALIALLVARQGEEAVQAVARREAVLEQLGAYWTPEPARRTDR